MASLVISFACEIPHIVLLSILVRASLALCTTIQLILPTFCLRSNVRIYLVSIMDKKYEKSNTMRSGPGRGQWVLVYMQALFNGFICLRLNYSRRYHLTSPF
jgi:hypothetical protein